MTNSTWPDERIETLRQLWADGYSITQCAKLLGVSRNVALGQISRHCPKRQDATPTVGRAPAIGQRTQGSSLGGGHVVLARAKVLAAITVAPRVQAPKGELKPLVADLTALQHHHCKWPIGDRDFAFCGRQRVDGQPYCAAHISRAYTGLPPYRKHRKAA